MTTHYLYSGTLLISEYTDTETIVYIYDANGSPLGFKYRLSTYAEDVWDTYWYEKNMQGDIVAIYSENGTKLISYLYDAWGNASISYTGGIASYNSWTYGWTSGRLTSLKNVTRRKALSITTVTQTYSFNYNAFGQRIDQQYSKTYGDTTHVLQDGELISYNKVYNYDNSGRLVHERNTKTFVTTGNKTTDITYLYDESGMIGMVYTTSSPASTTYCYYRRNLQGDVTGIYAADGTRLAEYAYDAYGNCTVVYAQNSDIANNNPIRYRGYYFDVETQLYWVSSRYYSPELCRWISPDSIEYLDPQSINGLNLYAYCGNDPINKYDPTGHFAISLTVLGLIIGAAIGVTAGGIAAYNIAKNNGAEGWELFGWTMAGIVGGGVIGGALGAGVGALVTKATGVIGLSITKYSIIPIKGTTVLGHMPGYIGAAQATGSGYYLVSNGTYDKMVQKGVEWTNNMTYLKDANSLGSRFALAPDFVVREGGTFWKEIQYLIENGIPWEMF